MESGPLSGRFIFENAKTWGVDISGYGLDTSMVLVLGWCIVDLVYIFIKVFRVKWAIAHEYDWGFGVLGFWGYLGDLIN